MNHFLVFGTHPALGLAEFSAVRPSAQCTKIENIALVEDPSWDGGKLMSLLGGTVKLGDVIGALPLDSADGEGLADLVLPLLDGTSFDFGCTVYGSKKISSKLPIQLKKALKARGIASRWVTGKGGETIAPAAISKLKLTTKGLDLCLFAQGSKLLVGRTTYVQDADAWSFRDYGRPKRDDVVGMLPPKLARMMVNLANIPPKGTILDPFCGGGTVLMEAALATEAARILGSDNNEIQMSNAEENTQWLIDHHVTKNASRIELELADARTVGKEFEENSIDAVVTEGTLGPPLKGRETMTDLQKNAKDIVRIWKAFLSSIHPALTETGRVVGVWPTFTTPHGSAAVELSNVDIDELGYRLALPVPLTYQRPGQFVARRIFVLEKK